MSNLYGERYPAECRLAECHINKKKHYRHILGRFDTLAKTYLGFMHLVGALYG